MACHASSDHDRAAPPASAHAEPEESDEEKGVSGVEGEGDDPSFAANPGAPAASGPPGQAISTEALRIVTTATSSTYSHKTHIAGTTYDVDCSGFVDYVLARVQPAAFEEVRTATVKRPLAKHYVDFFRQAAPENRSGRWQRIERVSDLVAGDLLAWKRPADLHSSNTGHVMVVLAPPRSRDKSAWIVPIADSTASPHGKGDSRKAAGATGVGRGDVLVEVDAAGAPVAYVWSEGSRSRRHATEVAMGRRN